MNMWKSDAIHTQKKNNFVFIYKQFFLKYSLNVFVANVQILIIVYATKQAKFLIDSLIQFYRK